MRTAHLLLALCTCASALLVPRSFLAMRPPSPLLRLRLGKLASSTEDTPETDSAAALEDSAAAASGESAGPEGAEPMDLDLEQMFEVFEAADEAVLDEAAAPSSEAAASGSEGSGGAATDLLLNAGENSILGGVGLLTGALLFTLIISTSSSDIAPKTASQSAMATSAPVPEMVSVAGSTASMELSPTPKAQPEPDSTATTAAPLPVESVKPTPQPEPVKEATAVAVAETTPTETSLPSIPAVTEADETILAATSFFLAPWLVIIPILYVVPDAWLRSLERKFLDENPTARSRRPR